MQYSTMHDITVTLEDRPGTLAKALEIVAAQGLNVEGAAGIPCGNEGIFHLLFKSQEDADKAKRTLESGGFRVPTSQPVVAVAVTDKPGEAAKLFQEIADAKVNVNLTYLATNTRIIVGANNIQKVAETLGKPTTAATAR